MSGKQSRAMSSKQSRAMSGKQSRAASMMSRAVVIPRAIFIATLLLVILGLTGCSGSTTAEQVTERVIPVEVKVVEEEIRPQVLSYIGTFDAQTLKQYAFKTGGLIEQISVAKGDQVKAGQVLATLDKTQLNLAVEASALTQEKALKAYEDAKRQYDNLVKLFEAGAAPQNELDLAKLNYEVKLADYEQAKLDYQAKQTMIDDAILKADAEGYVVEVLYEQGELAGQGYPVVICRSSQAVVNVGLTQADAGRVKPGSPAKIKLNGAEMEGEVVTVDALPDQTTRTYNAEIRIVNQLPPESFHLGASVKVEIAVGEEQGIWVPILSVQNDGEDYVYVVETGRAMRKTVRLGMIQGFDVQVQGLTVGDSLVVAGMKELRQGFKVDVKETVTDEQKS